MDLKFNSKTHFKKLNFMPWQKVGKSSYDINCWPKTIATGVEM